MKNSEKKLVEKTKEQLSSINRELTKMVFPLSVCRRDHQMIAHAIAAITLAQCILRDIHLVED